MSCHSFNCLTLVAAAVALTIPHAQAQNYPVKPIRIISPYTAGGLGDLVPPSAAD